MEDETMTYEEGVARSAARRANLPWVRCACGENTEPERKDGSTLNNTGIHSYQCGSCGRRWNTMRDWSPDQKRAHWRGQWMQFHEGHEPSASMLDYFAIDAPKPACCECSRCKPLEGG